MKKILSLAVILALALATIADARTITEKLAENDGTYSWTLANSASDTTKVYTLTNAKWVSDGAADADGALIAWVGFTYTAASTDSFSCIIDYYIGGVKSGTTNGALAAATSAAMNVVAIDPGFLADSFRVRVGNTDVTGTASATGVQVWLVYKEE
jgi:hypothetical protein